MTIPTFDNPVSANAMDHGGWLIYSPIQSQQADRRLVKGDGISQLLTVLSEVVVPEKKGYDGNEKLRGSYLSAMTTSWSFSNFTTFFVKRGAAFLA